MKNSSSSPVRRIGLLLMGVGLCATFTGCIEERRPVHHGYYDHRYDRRHDRYDDRSYDRGPSYRRSGTAYYDTPTTSVTIRRGSPGYYERY